MAPRRFLRNDKIQLAINHERVDMTGDNSLSYQLNSALILQAQLD